MSKIFNINNTALQWKDNQEKIEIQFLPFYDENKYNKAFKEFLNFSGLSDNYYFECKPENQYYKPGECYICDLFYEDLYLQEIEESFLAV